MLTLIYLGLLFRLHIQICDGFIVLFRFLVAVARIPCDCTFRQVVAFDEPVDSGIIIARYALQDIPGLFILSRSQPTVVYWHVGQLEQVKLASRPAIRTFERPFEKIDVHVQAKQSFRQHIESKFEGSCVSVRRNRFELGTAQ